MQTCNIHRKSRARAIASTWIFPVIISLFLVFSSSTAEFIKSGISLCLDTVIPSVFPFMVISALIISLGAGRDLGYVFSPPIRLIFGTSHAAACPIIIGLICGYPSGAFAAAAMYDGDEISKGELTRLLTFINVPGAAFVIGAIGEGMLSSKKLGVAIYFSVLMAAITVGIACRFFEKKTGKSAVSPQYHDTPILQAIPTAIRSAAANMLTVSACVVTFSAVSGLICSLPFMDSAPWWIKTAVTGFLEVSSGARAASALGGIYAPLIASSVCAWSGLSVQMQIISACRGRGISFVPFFVSKAVQAVLAPAYLLIFLHFFG